MTVEGDLRLPARRSTLPTFLGRQVPPLQVAGPILAIVIVNMWLLAMAASEMGKALDWGIIERAARLAGEPELYEPRSTWTFVWSPIAAYAVQGLAPLGLTLWRILTVGFALALPTWRLRMLVLVSGPFWLDIATGNILTAILFVTIWALRGSRLATVAFFVIALLIPRPLLAPIVLWILWRRPEWRIPFLLLFVAHALLVLVSGLGPEWISTTLAVGPEIQANTWNLSPTRWIGWWWLLAGLPLAACLTVRGHLGWAGLAASPYIWPYYLLFGLLDSDRSRWAPVPPVAVRQDPRRAMPAGESH